MAVGPIAPSTSLRPVSTDLPTLQRLADGATVEAKVVARLPNGVARLQIGSTLIDAKAPPTLAMGAMVTLTVAKSSEGVRLVMATPAPTQYAPPPIQPTPSPVSPAVSTSGAVSTLMNSPTTSAPRPVHVAPPSGAAAVAVPSVTVDGAPNVPPALGQVGAPEPLVTGRGLPSAPGATPGTALPLSAVQAAPASAPPAVGVSPATAPPAVGGVSPAPAGPSSPVSAPPLPPGGGATADLPGSLAGARPPAGPVIPAAPPTTVGAPTPTAANASTSALGSGLPTAAAASAPSAAPEPASAPPATRAVLAATVHQALARQDDLAPVLALATQALASPAIAAKLPVDAQRFLSLLLGLKIEVPTPGAPRGKAALTAETLKAAVAASGVFFEQTLAKGQAGPRQGDLKAILMALASLAPPEDGAPAEPAPPAERPGPPIRRDDPEARPATRAVTLDPPNALRQLSESAGAAVERVRLLQYASLDAKVDGAPARTDPQPGQTREMMFELPFQVGRETHVVPFRITRDAPERRGGEGPSEPVWKLSFAIAVEPIGPVHARLTLRGERLDVRLVAERPEVAARMAAASGELRRALGGEGLIDLEGVSIEHGRPGPTTASVERRA